MASLTGLQAGETSLHITSGELSYKVPVEVFSSDNLLLNPSFEEARVLSDGKTEIAANWSQTGAANRVDSTNANWLIPSDGDWMYRLSSNSVVYQILSVSQGTYNLSLDYVGYESETRIVITAVTEEVTRSSETLLQEEYYNDTTNSWTRIDYDFTVPRDMTIRVSFSCRGSDIRIDNVSLNRVA